MNEMPSPSERELIVTPLIDSLGSTVVSGGSIAFTTVPGYEVFEEIGRGGMGVVYRARDEAMNREVAVKILQDKFAPDSSTAARFIEEAHITGQLQHPGIPAVYRVGALEDSRPFLAMKLIKGRTLDVIIKSGKPIAYLPIVEAMSQAVGYAHAHGVIHRDLKPANVMVGNFGEVQVMDWGLAKVLAKAPISREEVATTETTPPTDIKSPRDSDTPFTQYGSVIGTPAFLPPEQAAGELHRVDQRSDVFGLGAVLCAMLTGKPPFTGDNVEAVKLNAVRGQTEEAFARLDASGAEPDAIALCKRCLSFEPADRPSNARELAAEVARLRQAAEERAKLAEMDKAKAEVFALAETKRRKLLQRGGGALAAVLLLGITGTSIGMYRAYWAKEAEKARAEGETQAKNNAEKAEKLADTRRIQAELARDDARRRYIFALDAYKQMVSGIQTKLAMRPATLELRKDLLENARSGLQTLLQEAEKLGTPDSTLVWSYFRLGDVELALGNTQAASKEYRLGHAIVEQLAKGEPDNPQFQRDLGTSFSNLGEVAQRLGQTQDSLSHYQKALSLRQDIANLNPKDLEAQRLLALSLKWMGDTSLKLNRAEEGLNFYEKSGLIIRSLATADPNNVLIQADLRINYRSLGDASLRLGRTNDALDYYSKALAISDSLANADPKNTEAQNHVGIDANKLGMISLRIGRSQKALEFFQRSSDIFQSQSDADPKNAQKRANLGKSLQDQGNATFELGKIQDAHTLYQSANRLMQKIVEDDPEDMGALFSLALSHEKLGNTALQLGQPKEALDFYTKNNQICKRLVNADPADSGKKQNLSVSFAKLGDVATALGEEQSAFDSYKQALQVSQMLVDADPKNSNARRGVSVCFVRLGDAASRLGQPEEALIYYQKFNRFSQQQADADPKSAIAQRDLAVSLKNLGDVKRTLGMDQEAIDHYREYNRMFEGLAARDPKSVYAQRNLAISHALLANVHSSIGQFTESVGYFRRYYEVSKRLAETDEKNIPAQIDLYTSLRDLGIETRRSGDFVKALEWFVKARAVVFPLHEKNQLKGLNKDALKSADLQVEISQAAPKAVKELDYIFTTKPEMIPSLVRIRVDTFLDKKDTANAITTTNRFIEWVEKQEKDLPTLYYSTAQLLAKCANADAKAREHLVEMCLKMLVKCRERSYFTTAQITRFRTDSSFVGLRQEPKFKSFVEELIPSKK